MVVDDSGKKNGLNFVFFLEICGYAFALCYILCQKVVIQLITLSFIRHPP